MAGFIQRLMRGRQQSEGGAYGGIVGMGARRYQAYAWDFQRVANSVYANPTGYRCVQWLANNFARPPFMLTDADKNPVRDSPLQLLLNRPDVNYSGTEMQWAMQRDKQLCGKSFWVMLRGPDQQISSGPITALRRLPPQRVTVVGNDDDELMGFIYADRGGNRALILPENMLYVRHPHPEREYDGLAPALMAGLGAETDNASARFNYDLLSNDSALPGYVSVQDLTPTQFLEWKALWESGEYPGKTRFLAGNATYSKVGQSNQEMMYDKLRDGARLDMCTAFGVLRQLVDPSDTTFSNMAEAKSLTMQQTVLPDWVMIGDQMSTQLLDEYPGVDRIFFDLSEIEELQISAKERLDRQIRLLDRRAVTINEVRRELGYKPVPWGDDPFANLAPNTLGVQPLTGAPSLSGGQGGSAEGGSQAPGEAKPESATAGGPPALNNGGGRNQAALLPALTKGSEMFDKRVATFEQRAAKRLEAFFALQADVIARRMRDKAGKSLTKAMDPEQWWDGARWDGELQRLSYEFLADTIDYFGGAVLAEKSDAGVFEITDATKDWLEEQSKEIADRVNRATNTSLRVANWGTSPEGLEDVLRQMDSYFVGKSAERAACAVREQVKAAAELGIAEGQTQSEKVMA